MKKTLLIGIMALHLAAGSQDVLVHPVDRNPEYGKNGALLTSTRDLTNPPSVFLVGSNEVSKISMEFVLTTNWIRYDDDQELGVVVSNVFAKIVFKGQAHEVQLEQTPINISGLRLRVPKTNVTAKVSIKTRPIKPSDFKWWYSMNGGPIWWTPDP